MSLPPAGAQFGRPEPGSAEPAESNAAYNVPNNNSSFVSVTPTTHAHDSVSLEERVKLVAGDRVCLEDVLIKSKFISLERDPVKLRDALVKEFNKNVQEPIIINAGARAGTRVDPGYFMCAHRNKVCEIRAGMGERLCLPINVSYTDFEYVGNPENGVVSQTEPLIGAYSTHLVNVPRGRFAKIWLGQQPLLLDEGCHVFHDPLFRADRSSFLVDQSTQHIAHGTLQVLRVPPAHFAKVTVNSVPLLLPYRVAPYVFNTALFKFDGNVAENASYINYPPLHVVRVPAGSVAKVWQGSRPLLLEYRDGPYFFEDSAFRAEANMFVSANQKLITHGSLNRLRPGVNGDLEKAVVQSDGGIRFVDRFTILDSVQDAVLGFVNMGINTCVFPSRATREERRRDTRDATSDDINYEILTTKDSLKLGMKLLVAYQISDPEVVLSKLRLQDIEPHVENLAVSDMVRAVQHTSSQNFVNAISHSSEDPDGDKNPLGPGKSVADMVREQLDDHLRECGLKLIRFNVEEAKVLDQQIAKEMSKQSLIAATANAEQAVLAQKAAIARSQAEVDAMSKRVKQEQENQMKVTAAQADLDSARLRAQSLIVEAEAKTKSAQMEAQLLREYPELLQLRLAQLQFNALGRASMTIVSPELSHTPYALGAQGLWPVQQIQERGAAASAAAGSERPASPGSDKKYGAQV